VRFASYVTLIVCGLLMACGADFESSSQVSKLRLLALRADAPFAKPEQAVMLEPLVADPETRAISWAFATCTDPAASTATACLSALDGPFSPFDPRDGMLTVKVGDMSLYTRSQVLGVAVVACPGQLEDGRTENIPVRCRDDGGALLPLERFEVGVKRIFVRLRDQNENPSIEMLMFDGEPWDEALVPEVEGCKVKQTDDIDECPSELHHRIAVKTSPAERGVDERGVPFEEQQVVQAYTTQGVFEFEVRIASDANNSFAALRGEELSTLWFVVRDDRGGVGWVSRQVKVR
jgi:hypothetical protein